MFNCFLIFIFLLKLFSYLFVHSLRHHLASQTSLKFAIHCLTFHSSTVSPSTLLGLQVSITMLGMFYTLSLGNVVYRQRIVLVIFCLLDTNIEISGRGNVKWENVSRGFTFTQAYEVLSWLVMWQDPIHCEHVTPGLLVLLILESRLSNSWGISH